MKFKVSVPATSANVGPGFDMMGIAFDMFNRFTFETGGNELFISGCEPQFAKAENNLVYKTLEKTLQSYGRPVPGMSIHFDTDVPLSSGLGSSSTCIVAGIMAANQIGGLNFDKGEILRIASLIEGHPDNVAPAILGGFVAAIIENDFVYWHEYSISDKLSFYALMPDVRVSTEEARKILPASYSLSDCVATLVVIAGLLIWTHRKNIERLKNGTESKTYIWRPVRSEGKSRPQTAQDDKTEQDAANGDKTAPAKGPESAKTQKEA